MKKIVILLGALFILLLVISSVAADDAGSIISGSSRSTDASDAFDMRSSLPPRTVDTEDVVESLSDEYAFTPFSESINRRRNDDRRIIMTNETVLDSSGGALVTTDLTTDLTPENLVETLLGPGIHVSNVQYVGADLAAGTFSGGTGIIGFEEGIILSTGRIDFVVGPNVNEWTSWVNNMPGDPDLDALVSPGQTYDAAVLAFDFVPTTDIIHFEYVFASDEYHEYVGSQYNDVFAFFVNGENIAIIPGTLDTPVAINNVNAGNAPDGIPPSNPSFFVNNYLNYPREWDPIDAPYNIAMNGFTTVLSATAHVNAGEVNHIKMAIADTQDYVLDSNVFIRAESFVSPMLTLSPLHASKTVGDTHQITAELRDSEGDPIPGATINLNVISGPHTGFHQSGVTGATGIAYFNLPGDAAGTDTIVASYGAEQSNYVYCVWISPEPGTPYFSPHITHTPSVVLPGVPFDVIWTVTNIGDGEGTQDVTLESMYEGHLSPVIVETVTLAPGESWIHTTHGYEAVEGLYEYWLTTDNAEYYHSIHVTGEPAGDFINILSLDPRWYPTIRGYVHVDSPAGLGGLLGIADFSVTENGVAQTITSVEFISGGEMEGSPIDIAIVFDDTGSMGPYIAGMKAQVIAFTEAIEASGMNARYMLVTFKGYNDPEPITLRVDWTYDADELKTAVDALYASGGGEIPEVNLDALAFAMSRGFRPDAQRVILDITDAPTHYRGDMYGYSEYTIPEIADMIRGHGVTFILVSKDLKGTTWDGEERNKQYLAEAVGGLWVDIDERDFSEIIEYITGILTHQYIITYITTITDIAIRTVIITVNDPTLGLGADTGIYTVPLAPSADFTADYTTGDAPLTVQFFDTSTGYPTLWDWDFGDGSASTHQHPSKTYTTPGVYTVSLAVTNAVGSDTETKVGYITVTGEPGTPFFSPHITHTPAVVYPGDHSFEVIWTVTNTGDGPGTQEVLMHEIYESHLTPIFPETVTLAPGESWSQTTGYPALEGLWEFILTTDDAEYYHSVHVTDEPTCIYVGVFSNGYWFVRDPVTGGVVDVWHFGSPGDILFVLPDGRVGVFGNGYWFVRDPVTGGIADFWHFGSAGDIPFVLPDGRVGVYANGYWFVRDPITGGVADFWHFGITGDRPFVLPDGRTGVFGCGRWFVRDPATGGVAEWWQFGISSDTPFVLPDGRIGVFGNGYWFVRDPITGGIADFWHFGSAGDLVFIFYICTYYPTISEPAMVADPSAVGTVAKEGSYARGAESTTA